MTWINWRELETQIPLEQLPEFHRDFLNARGVQNTQEMMLRRVQQSVERELNTLIREGHAKYHDEQLLVANHCIPEKWLP
jgi:beta-galactosidase beta subunit